MKRPSKRLDIVRDECRTAEGRRKLRCRMRHRWFCTPSFARDLVDATAGDVSTDPKGSLALARFCVQIARRSGDRCSHTRSVGILSGARRLLGQRELSERTLGIAFKLSAGCGCCQPFLYRTLAYLRLYQYRWGLASRASERAVESGLLLNDRVEEGRSLLCRAVVRGYRKHLEKALADAEGAVSVLPCVDPQYSSALHQYALILAWLGDPASVKRAAEFLGEIEEAFRGLKGLSVERAKLAWLRGEIERARGDDREAQRYLERARAGFIRLELPLELAAVCADIGATQTVRKWPMEAVRRLFAATADAANARGIVFPAELRIPLDRVLQATRGSVAELRAALRELRDATVELGCPPPILAYP